MLSEKGKHACTCVCILTSSRVVPTRTLVNVVDEVNLSLGSDGLFPARGKRGIEVCEGETGGLVGLRGAESLGLVEG